LLFTRYGDFGKIPPALTRRRGVSVFAPFGDATAVKASPVREDPFRSKEC
jgi:hypothetical protein